ncbi:protein kinase domain-containing protein [Actinospongicola halichondriae]|uniref:protein kinase domain-containing protein n=1 Tax=Actinospongicola halichondriae TaxID=3236844 RepID=UPI003D5CA877
MSEHPTRPTPVTPEHASDDPAPASAPNEPRQTRPEPVAPADASPAPERPAGDLGEGSLIAGRYRLGTSVARGGMATVWRAVDEVLARPVAVKILHAHLAADPDFVARFRREAVAAARVGHPSIVAIYDTCGDPEAIVMELVDGRTLRDELNTRRFLPPSEAVEIASGIAQALEVAHKAGLVHRDVKPANVLLSSDGRLKVADFGIAKAARPDEHPDLADLTSVGSMVGTAKYLAPEQVSGGDVDARTDVYALGAVLYEMVCGRPPFQGDNDLATATARLHGPPDRPRAVLRTVPERLDAIIMRALSTRPDERYESAAAMWADLQAAPLDADTASTGPVATADATAVVAANTTSFAKTERSWLVPAALVSVIAIALGLAWALIGGTEARRDLFDLVDRVAPGGGGSAEPLDIVEARDFDPVDPDTGFGGDGENGDVAARAIDDDETTFWSTENYDTRSLGGLKAGVGITFDLGESFDLDELRITSPDANWSGTVHVSDSPHDTFAAWGDPVATIESAESGTTTVSLDDSQGSYVLLWITDLGDGPPRVSFDLQELVVTGR